MPENVPPKETAKADGLNPNEQAPGVPRAPIGGPASVSPTPPGATFVAAGDKAGATPAPAAAGTDDEHPGEGFVRIRWKEKIGGHEKDEEWAEERRARNLVGSGHAEIVEQDKGKK